MRSGIWRINQDKLDLLTLLPTSDFGNEIKNTVFHTTDAEKVLSVIDNHFVIWDMNGSDTKVRWFQLFQNMLFTIKLVLEIPHFIFFQVI